MAWIARIDRISVQDADNLSVAVTYYDDTVLAPQDQQPIPQLSTTLMFPVSVTLASATAKIIEVGMAALKCYTKSVSLQNRVGTTITVA